MSYILDALRKSETERRQGKVPDLGQSVQLIHKPKKQRLSPALAISLGLALNAVVLAVVFWPAQSPSITLQQAEAPVSERVAGEPDPVVPGDAAEIEQNDVQATGSVAPSHSGAPASARQAVAPVPRQVSAEQVTKPEPAPARRERPTIIVPSSPPVGSSAGLPAAGSAGRVPHLVELPLSFQKSVPDLTFNSHIYSSEPSARRVMINNQYLRRGDSFSGIAVDNITEDGVVLSKQGQRFRVGIVRDWVSPR